MIDNFNNNNNNNSTPPSSPKQQVTTAVVEVEVDYHDACTALFKSIEEMEWMDALDIVRRSPSQVKTWVRSVGTENTTFDWSKFRRLPIHEACMRQAPAWFISELLSKYPESAYMATNLDELPLHLAVDKDCGPEVVNLIIVANLTAIVAQDQAGRTPIDIMNRDELLQLEEYRVVYESLGRCHKTYMELQKASQEEQASIKRKHKATFNAVSKRHQEELKAENDKKAKLRDEIEDLKAQLGDMLEVNKAKDHHLKKNQQEKERWMDTVRDLEAQVLSLQRSLQSEKNQIQELQLKLQQKDENLNHKQDQIDVISNDLRNIVVSNETDVIEALIETEQSMRKMVSNQIALQKLLTSNSKNLTEVLKQRNIRMPREEIQARTQQKIARALADEEDEKKVDDPDPVETEAASAAMMAAAMAALQPLTP